MHKAAIDSGERDKAARDVTQQLRTVLRDAEACLHRDVDAGSAVLSDLRTRLEANVQSARRALSQAEDQLQKRARVVVESADSYIHAHVWQTVSVGALAGLVIGMLVARREPRR